MKDALLILSLFLSLASIRSSSEALPQNKPDTQAPTLEQILDKYVQALGDHASLGKVNSRGIKSIFTSDHLKTNGPIQLYAKSPEQESRHARHNRQSHLLEVNPLKDISNTERLKML